MDKNLLIIYYKALDYQKDPDPDHWRTISGAKVHLDNDGEIDGGAGGKFTGNYWDGKKGGQHIVGPHNMIKKNIASGATEMGLPKLDFFKRIFQQNNTKEKESNSTTTAVICLVVIGAIVFALVLIRNKNKTVD